MRARAVACLALAVVVAVVAAASPAAAASVRAGAAVERSRAKAAVGHGHRHKHAVDRRPPDLSRYHSTEQLIAKFRALQSECPHLTVGTRRGETKELVTVTVSRPQSVEVAATGKDKLRVLLFFGEHARELISPETALRFTQMLCGHTPAGHPAPSDEALARIARVVDGAEVLLFPVINADGHAKVVRGSYCTRTNARGVDLNRNWDEHWKRSRRADTNGGPHAFSEDEVRVLRDAATHFNPDMFVSIHSGALGMYTPYAYSTKRPSGVVEQQMVSILKRLNPHYCNCDVGAAGKELNYLCPGTCLDYVFDKLQTPYAFAVEIWEGGYGFKKQPHSARTPFEQLLQTHERVHHGRSNVHAHTHDHAHAHAHSGAKRSLARAHNKAVRHTGTGAAAASEHADAVPPATADALSLGSCFLLKEQSAHRGTADADAEAEVDADAEVLFPPPPSTAAHTCLSSFNPTNPSDYVATTDNWSHALLHMIERVLDTDHRAPKRVADDI